MNSMALAIQNRYIQKSFRFIFRIRENNFNESFYTIILLVMSNTFMTFAWYGHLKMKTMSKFENLSMLVIILISWGIAFFEYVLQVPANRIGYSGTGGPFPWLN